MKIKDYFTPKSMIYTGRHEDVKTTITHYHYTEDSIKMTDSFEPLSGYKHYIKVVGLSDIDTISEIKSYYPIADIVLEDVFNVRQRNKIEVHDEYIFSVFRCEYLHEGSVHESYLSIVLFDDTLISFHEYDPIILKPLHELLHSYDDLRKRSVDFLYYQILDIITDHHLDVFDYLETFFEVFEEDILESKSLDQQMFYTTRKHLLKLKNNVSPILENLEKLFSKKHALFRIENVDYFDDLKDHLLRLDNHLNQSRELTRHLLDLQINNQSNKMNRIMTTLTLFSAIFIPLSFLTGFFGMNFVYFEILEYEHSLAIFIGLCFLLAVCLVLLFKKMKWF